MADRDGWRHDPPQFATGRVGRVGSLGEGDVVAAPLHEAVGDEARDDVRVEVADGTAAGLQGGHHPATTLSIASLEGSL